MKAKFENIPRNAIFKVYISQMETPEAPFIVKIDGVIIAEITAKNMEVLEVTVTPQEAIESLPETVTIEVSNTGTFLIMEEPKPVD